MFGCIGRAVGEPRLGVATEQLARVGLDSANDGSGKRTDPGDRGHPEHEAGEKDAQTPDARRAARGGQAAGRERPKTCSQRALRGGDLRGAPIFDDPAVQKVDLAPAAFSHTRIVRD